MGILWSFLLSANPSSVSPTPVDSLVKIKVLDGELRPKSISSSGLGQFLIANPQYQPSVVVFSKKFQRLKNFNDSLFTLLPSSSKSIGSEKQVPITACFSHFGKYAWIASNPLLGSGTTVPNEARCEDIYKSPSGYLVKLNTLTSEVEAHIPLGKFPRYLLATPDSKYLIAANSCSKDIHIIDCETNEIVQQMVLGSYPQGLATDANSSLLFVTLTEASSIAVVDLRTFEIQKLSLGPRVSPMYIQVSPSGNTIYASLAGTGELAKYLFTGDSLVLSQRVVTGRSPRSIALTPDASFIYVANYLSHTVSKVRTEDMQVVDSIHTSPHPTDIAFDPSSGQLWVASYHNQNVTIYEDRSYLPQHPVAKTQVLKNPFSYSIESYETRSTGSSEPAQVVSPTSFTGALITPSDSVIHLIVGSFSERENANSYLRKLTQKGLDVFLLPTEEGVIRVGMGSYNSLQGARLASSRLKQTYGISAWLKIR